MKKCSECECEYNNILATCPACGNSLTAGAREAGLPFVKADAGKLRYSLLPPKALRAVVRVLEFGAKKYGRGNWSKMVAEERVRYVDAIFRHLEAWRGGEPTDPDTGESHMAHIVCSALFLLGFTEGDA